MVFEAGYDPPWYQPNAPRDDIPESAMSQDDIEKWLSGKDHEGKGSVGEKKKLYEAKGRINPFPPPDETIMIPGFIGKAKGIKQILWERGLWKAGMVRSKTPTEIKQLMLLRLEPPSNDMCYDKVLSACTDFALEKIALEEMIESRGHILIYSVAGHPQLAGVAVEYCWGCSKRHFRKENTTLTKDFRPLMMYSLSENVLSLLRVIKFERKAWTYKQMYLGLKLQADDSGEPIDVTYDELEKRMKTIKKEHRNIGKIEGQWLKKFDTICL